MTSESAPAIVAETDFGLTNALVNKARLLELKRARPLVLSTITLGDGSKASLYKTGEGQNGSVFIEHRELIGLYIQYATWHYSFLPVRALTQTKLWRSKTLPVTNTFSQRIFFNNILRMTGAVLSDAEHTDYGRDFWMRRLREALQKHLNVALVDFGSKTYEQISSPKRLEALFDAAWSEEAMKKPKYMQLRWLVWR